MPFGIVYKLENIVNGMVYVGQTTRSLEKRFKEHFNHKRKFGFIGTATMQYGKEAFTISELATASTSEELVALETEWIKRLDCIAPNGYNRQLKGCAGKRSEETKQKIATLKSGANNFWFGKNRPEHSASMKGSGNPFFGKTHSEESKRIIGDKSKGRTFTEQDRQRISEGVSKAWEKRRARKLVG